MDKRQLGQNGPMITIISYGALKIGRNKQVRYDQAYELPSDADVERLLSGVLDLGVNFIDTAPAYGNSEKRIAAAIGHRRDEYVLSTKVGETFDDESHFDFTGPAVRASVEQSLRNLRTDMLDVVLIHSNGEDVKIMQQTDVVDALQSLRDAGKIKQIGLSGKTVEGAEMALGWADVLMVPYHSDDRSHENVIEQAHQRGVGVLLKKALASGRLDPGEALQFALQSPAVTSAVIGTLSLDHLAADIAAVS